jgi:hypothetical protein
VYYAGSDALLFKLPADATGAGATFELKRTAIGAIQWCTDVRSAQTAGAAGDPTGKQAPSR